MTNPITAAPRDGTVILATTELGLQLTCRWLDTFLTEDEQPCGCWVATTDTYPECWSGGVCWESNVDGIRSDQPVWGEAVEEA